MAHEMYYKGYVYNWEPIPLVWDEMVSGKAHLKMNADLLSANYAQFFETVSEIWPNASSKVSVTRTDFYSAKVAFGTATEAEWKRRFGNAAKDMQGITDITSTDGILIKDAASAEASSGRIKYAAILLTPYSDSFEHDDHIKATMVHEIGHALGLGHPNYIYYPTEEPSIMRSWVDYEGYYVPQQHDIDDLDDKY